MLVRAMVERGPYVRFVWALVADDVLHGMDEFLGKMAVGDENHTDHGETGLRNSTRST